MLGLRIALLAVLCLPGLAVAATTRAVTSGTTYYVRALGADTADGLSPQTAWRSVARVDQAALRPGDQVLFNGGDSFPGLIYVAPGTGGTAAAPIVFSSYGSGVATISGGAGGGFFAYDAAGVAIENLDFIGSGAANNVKDGVLFYNDLPGGTKLSYIRIANIDVSGFGKAGISFGGWNGSSGFTNVQVTSSATHHNRLDGLITFGPVFNPATPSYANSDFYIGHVSAYANQGDPTLATNSGNGIVLGSVQGGTVERSSAWGNGSLCTARQCGAGIWAYDSTLITIQNNESYSNSSSSHVDGDGFDLDQNVSYSNLQYNYSHGNAGAGFLDYSGLSNAAHAGDTIRYNVSQNDARSNDGAITIAGHVYQDAVYQNTVYVSASSAVGVPAVMIGAGPLQVSLRNNILYAASGCSHLVASAAFGTPAVIFQGNDYAGSFRVVWGSSVYAGLDAWRQASGQERLGTSATGLVADPELTSPGGGGTVGNPDLLSSLTAYRLLPGSPVAVAGLNLGVLFATTAGTHDYYGNPVKTPPSIGASE